MPAYNRVSIKTLMVSSKTFDRNRNKGDREGKETCCLCGLATEPKHFVHIVDYGVSITDSEEEYSDSIGWHAVGPCCFKRVKKMFGGEYPAFLKG